MRSALNENPMVQMIVLGVAVVIFAFLMFTTVLKKDEPVEDAPATEVVATDPGAVDPAAAAPPVDAGAVPPPADTGSVPPPASTGSSDGLLPSKGLPKDLLVAYARGDAIALVVVDEKVKGSGRLVKAVERSPRGNLQAFEVDVNDIAKYSRITEGVSVSRAPALVVIRPRGLSEGAPVATVTYDITDRRTAEQAIEDAFYEGGNVPAYP